MSLYAIFKSEKDQSEIKFGVGDVVRVQHLIAEPGGKNHSQVFEGTLISLRGRGENKSFILRRIGVQKIGIEKIFPLTSPAIERIEVVRKGTSGVGRAKLYYTRSKSKKEIEKVFTRQVRRNLKK